MPSERFGNRVQVAVGPKKNRLGGHPRRIKSLSAIIADSFAREGWFVLPLNQFLLGSDQRSKSLSKQACVKRLLECLIDC